MRSMRPCKLSAKNKSVLSAFQHQETDNIDLEERFHQLDLKEFSLAPPLNGIGLTASFNIISVIILVDSGASVSLITAEMARQLGASLWELEDDLRVAVESATHHRIQMDGYVILVFYIGGCVYSHRFFVKTHEQEDEDEDVSLIMGTDLQGKIGIVRIDYLKGQVTLEDPRKPMKFTFPFLEGEQQVVIASDKGYEEYTIGKPDLEYANRPVSRRQLEDSGTEDGTSEDATTPEPTLRRSPRKKGATPGKDVAKRTEKTTRRGAFTPAVVKQKEMERSREQLTLTVDQRRKKRVSELLRETKQRTKLAQEKREAATKQATLAAQDKEPTPESGISDTNEMTLKQFREFLKKKRGQKTFNLPKGIVDPKTKEKTTQPDQGETSASPVVTSQDEQDENEASRDSSRHDSDDTQRVHLIGTQCPSDSSDSGEDLLLNTDDFDKIAEEISQILLNQEGSDPPPTISKKSSGKVKMSSIRRTLYRKSLDNLLVAREQLLGESHINPRLRRRTQIPRCCGITVIPQYNKENDSRGGNHSDFEREYYNHPGIIEEMIGPWDSSGSDMDLESDEIMDPPLTLLPTQTMITSNENSMECVHTPAARGNTTGLPTDNPVPPPAFEDGSSSVVFYTPLDHDGSESSELEDLDPELSDEDYRDPLNNDPADLRIQVIVPALALDKHDASALPLHAPISSIMVSIKEVSPNILRPNLRYRNNYFHVQKVYEATRWRGAYGIGGAPSKAHLIQLLAQNPELRLFTSRNNYQVKTPVTGENGILYLYMFHTPHHDALDELGNLKIIFVETKFPIRLDIEDFTHLMRNYLIPPLIEHEPIPIMETSISRSSLELQRAKEIREGTSSKRLAIEEMWDRPIPPPRKKRTKIQSKPVPQNQLPMYWYIKGLQKGMDPVADIVLLIGTCLINEYPSRPGPVFVLHFHLITYPIDAVMEELTVQLKAQHVYQLSHVDSGYDCPNPGLKTLEIFLSNNPNPDVQIIFPRNCNSEITMVIPYKNIQVHPHKPGISVYLLETLQTNDIQTKLHYGRDSEGRETSPIPTAYFNDPIWYREAQPQVAYGNPEGIFAKEPVGPKRCVYCMDTDYSSVELSIPRFLTSDLQPVAPDDLIPLLQASRFTVEPVPLEPEMLESLKLHDPMLNQASYSPDLPQGIQVDSVSSTHLDPISDLISFGTQDSELTHDQKRKPKPEEMQPLCPKDYPYCYKGLFGMYYYKDDKGIHAFQGKMQECGETPNPDETKEPEEIPGTQRSPSPQRKPRIGMLRITYPKKTQRGENNRANYGNGASTSAPLSTISEEQRIMERADTLPVLEGRLQRVPSLAPPYSGETRSTTLSGPTGHMYPNEPMIYDVSTIQPENVQPNLAAWQIEGRVEPDPKFLKSDEYMQEVRQLSPISSPGRRRRHSTSFSTPITQSHSNQDEHPLAHSNPRLNPLTLLAEIAIEDEKARTYQRSRNQAKVARHLSAVSRGEDVSDSEEEITIHSTQQEIINRLRQPSADPEQGGSQDFLITSPPELPPVEEIAQPIWRRRLKNTCRISRLNGNSYISKPYRPFVPNLPPRLRIRSEGGRPIYCYGDKPISYQTEMELETYYPMAELPQAVVPKLTKVPNPFLTCEHQEILDQMVLHYRTPEVDAEKLVQDIDKINISDLPNPRLKGKPSIHFKPSKLPLQYMKELATLDPQHDNRWNEPLAEPVLIPKFLGNQPGKNQMEYRKRQEMRASCPPCRPMKAEHSFQWTVVPPPNICRHTRLRLGSPLGPSPRGIRYRHPINLNHLPNYVPQFNLRWVQDNWPQSINYPVKIIRPQEPVTYASVTRRHGTFNPNVPWKINVPLHNHQYEYSK